MYACVNLISLPRSIQNFCIFLNKRIRELNDSITIFSDFNFTKSVFFQFVHSLVSKSSLFAYGREFHVFF
jgi:hypothetical protein